MVNLITKKEMLTKQTNSLAFLYRRWYLFWNEKYRGRSLIDERFFEEKFSALKAHIDVRIDGIDKGMDSLEKRMETSEKLMQQIWVEVEAIRSDYEINFRRACDAN